MILPALALPMTAPPALAAEGPPKAVVDCVIKSLGMKGAEALQSGTATAAQQKVLDGCYAQAGVTPAKDNGPSNDRPSSSSTRACAVPAGARRSSEVPIGILMPSGNITGQSYGSAASVKAAGFNAISVGVSFYYDDKGRVSYGRGGQTKQQWLNEVGCTVAQIKAQGLVALVWGQFQNINQKQGTEPQPVPAKLRKRVAASATAVMADLAKTLEKYKADYWSPVSEADKWLGTAGHNTYFPTWVRIGEKHFKGKIYAQMALNNGVTDPAGRPLAMGGADALSIAWVSFQCEDQMFERPDAMVAQARKQGVSSVFVGEIGGVRAGDPSDAACMTTVVDHFGARDTGVLFLDSPKDMEGGSRVESQWPAEWLLSLR